MLTPQETTSAAIELVDEYNFNQALLEYNWGGPLSIAWNNRRDLEHPPFNFDYSNRVHQWGFGGASIPDAVVNWPNFRVALDSFLDAWSAMSGNTFPFPPNPNCVRVQTLIDLLNIPGLGIARVSKWACFIDQANYAIYDSRVAYALRNLLSPQTKRRIFPFVGGRAAPAGQMARINQDNLIGDSRRTATAFINFLLVMREAAIRLNTVQPLNAATQDVVGASWTPALVEMALFQLGETRTKSPEIARVCGVTSHAWPLI